MCLILGTHHEPVTLLSIWPTGPRAPHRSGSVGPSPMPLWQMRGVRINGVSQLPKVTMLESGRVGGWCVYQDWVTVSHETHVIPHRRRCTFCVLPPQWWLLHRRQPVCVSCSQRDELKGDGEGVRGEEEHQESMKEEALILPAKEGIRNHLTALQLSRLPPASDVTGTEIYL